MRFERFNPITGKSNVMDLPVTEDQVRRWKGGELIQNAMPHLSADEREFLITGILPGDWENLVTGDR